MNEPDEITGLKGNIIPRRLSVRYVSFSAHVDYSQNAEFIDLIGAKHIVRGRFIPYDVDLRRRRS
jgi:cleavage and polyadenylation specificity factor subunit 3